MLHNDIYINWRHMKKDKFWKKYQPKKFLAYWRIMLCNHCACFKSNYIDGIILLNDDFMILKHNTGSVNTRDMFIYPISHVILRCCKPWWHALGVISLPIALKFSTHLDSLPGCTMIWRSPPPNFVGSNHCKLYLYEALIHFEAALRFLWSLFSFGDYRPIRTIRYILFSLFYTHALAKTKTGFRAWSNNYISHVCWIYTIIHVLFSDEIYQRN